ncbi:SIS domain-containing protein [Acidimicrobiaceae bacterium USS-CC1]|uniref:SIS domain-containing protein n=1 Tax=Acidiferrimicrobium australe TaxID=2664430 RepID=A0ABW9QZ33_9ACTN|nr:SIS domain-containing protein [Acidiferrimicrobium australe]
MTAPPRVDDGEVLAQLDSLLPSLSPSEQRVGRVILEDPARAARLTITDLAGLASTSETTVIRLCRSIGVGSYPNLRIALATAAGRSGLDQGMPRSPDISPDDDVAAVVAKIGATHARAITETVANLDTAELESVVAAVVAARHVDVYGVAASGYVALDLQQKLHRIGLTAYAWSDPHMALPSAANLGPVDVAIGFSHSGTTIDTIDALAQAREVGARTVAVTNFERSPIVRVADHVLRTSVSETSLRSAAMASRIAALTVVDCLFLGVAQQRYATTVDALDRTRASVRSRHRSRR